jgi:AcrR family transcriptional regulator
MFTERPYDDFSMEDLAAEAGVSKGLLYHYFPSKRSLYRDALRASVAELLALTEPDRSRALIDQVQASMVVFLAYVREHGGAYRAVLRGGIGTDPEVSAVTEEFRRTTRDRILEGLAVPNPHPSLRIAVSGWVGMVEAATMDWLEGSDLSLEDMVRMLTQALPAILAIRK